MKKFDLNLKLFIPRDAAVTECPGCKTPGSLVRRKSSGRTDHIIQKLTFRKKYHCANCKWDGKISVYRLTKKLKQVLLNYLIIAAASALLLLVIFFLSKS